MATTTSTIVVFTEDKLHFPVKHALLVMKQLFQYGVKNMYSKGGKIFISLSYSPRAITLRKKFGNLPVKYMRTKLENQDDFKVLENVIKRYRFNLLDEDIEDLDRKRIEAPGSKRKYYLEAPSLDDDDDDDDDELASTVAAPPPQDQDEFGFPICSQTI